MTTDMDILTLVGGDQAWFDRVKRALGWNEKLGADATADQVVARIHLTLDKIRTFEEEKHGIDSLTGLDTPQKILNELVQERAAKAAAEAATDVERTAKEAAEAEVARLTAELEAKLTEPIATIVW